MRVVTSVCTCFLLQIVVLTSCTKSEPIVGQWSSIELKTETPFAKFSSSGNGELLGCDGGWERLSDSTYRFHLRSRSAFWERIEGSVASSEGGATVPIQYDSRSDTLQVFGHRQGSKGMIRVATLTRYR